MTVWIDKSLSLNFKIRLMRSLVTSILLYACESWTLTAELQRRIQAMEMRCYCKILHISYKEHVANEGVRAKIQQEIGRTRRPPDHCKETQSAVVWSCLPFIRSGQGTVKGGRRCYVSWCFEPSQPQRITSGLKTNFNLSPSYS